MEISRRDFLKLSGGAAGGAALLGMLPRNKALAGAPRVIPLRKRIGESLTICPYDASGCGFIIATDGDNIINVEGDPDHPINRGAACSKGASLAQLRTVNGKLNSRRLTRPKYRAAGAGDWQEVEWDWAIDQIAARIKATRDATFIETDTDGYVVNRCDGIGSFGGAALDNEECYLLVKMLRTLGLCNIEHQARI
jgi:formate dehydrogenase major subunit